MRYKSQKKKKKKKIIYYIIEIKSTTFISTHRIAKQRRQISLFCFSPTSIATIILFVIVY